MNFPLLRNKPRRAFLSVFGSVGLFALALFLLQWLAPNAFAPVAMRISEPWFYIRDSAAVGFLSLGSFFSTHAALSKENTVLVDELARAKAENEFLKAISTVPENTLQTSRAREGVLIAAVLARPRWNVYDMLVIGAGYDDGVHTGMQIYASGFAIGEIAEVYAHTSLISLYSTAGKKIVAQIAGKFPVELIGSGGGTFEAEIAKDVPVSIGDGAFVPSISPKLFAVADAVEPAVEDAVKIFFRLPVNIFELRVVEVGI